MPRSTLKKAEVVIVGDNSITDIIATYLLHNSTKLLHIKEISDVRFLGDQKLSHEGQKIEFKKALVALSPTSRLPTIKGLSQTEYSTLPVDNLNFKSKRCVIYGQSMESVDLAIRLSENNKVTLIHRGNFLKDFDISVYDSVSRHLKAIGVNELGSTTILATTSKNGITNILTKTHGETKKIIADVLYIEREVSKIPDIGLNNQYLDPTTNINSMTNNIIVLNSYTNYSMGQALCIAKKLSGRRKINVVSTYSRTIGIAGMTIFSFGLLEQDLSETHHSYQKSIARTRYKLEPLNGYLKVLANSHRKIIAFSGIIRSDYNNIRMFYNAVSEHISVDKLLSQISTEDQLSSELLEIEREIS